MIDIKSYLKECGINPYELIETDDNCFYRLKDLIKNYIEEAGLVKNTVDLDSISKLFDRELIDKIQKSPSDAHVRKLVKEAITNVY